MVRLWMRTGKTSYTVLGSIDIAAEWISSDIGFENLKYRDAEYKNLLENLSVLSLNLSCHLQFLMTAWERSVYLDDMFRMAKKYVAFRSCKFKVKCLSQKELSKQAVRIVRNFPEVRSPSNPTVDPIRVRRTAVAIGDWSRRDPVIHESSFWTVQEIQAWAKETRNLLRWSGRVQN